MGRLCIYSIIKNKPRLLYFILPVVLIVNILEVLKFYLWWRFRFNFIEPHFGAAQSAQLLCLFHDGSIFSHLVASIIINMIVWTIVLLNLLSVIIRIKGTVDKSTTELGSDSPKD